MPLNKMCWVRKSQCGFLEVVRSVSWSITSESISNRVLGSEKHWHRAILTTLYLYPRDLFDVDDPLDSYAYEDNAARRSLEINRDLTVTVHFDWAELFFFVWLAKLRKLMVFVGLYRSPPPLTNDNSTRDLRLGGLDTNLESHQKCPKLISPPTNRYAFR